METPRPTRPTKRIELPTVIFVAAIFRMYYVLFVCVYTCLSYMTASVRRVYEERLGGNALRRDGHALEVKIDLDLFDLFLFCLTFFVCAFILECVPCISFLM